MANLASVIKPGEARTIMVDYLSGPSVEPLNIEHEAMCVEMGPSWMDAIIVFLKEGKLSDDHKEAHRIRPKSARFNLTAEGHLYRRSFTRPLLRCVHPSQVEDFLHEIHEEVYGSHTGGMSLAHRAITQGYWWPYMQKDAEAYVRKCEKCWRFAPLIHQPAVDLNPVSSPWPFAQ